jgi:hypothetical protein
MAKVAGVRGVTEKTFANVMKNVTEEELPDDLLSQDTLT